MSKASKAALLSGLLFPGLGHLYLKAYRRGIGLAVVALGCLVVIIDVAMTRAQAIADKVLSGELPMDAAAIAGQVSASAGEPGSTASQVCAWLLLACWLAGIVDSYRVGRSLPAGAIDGGEPGA